MKQNRLPIQSDKQILAARFQGGIYMKQKRKIGRKLFGFLLTLAMVVGLMPGMSLTAKAADEQRSGWRC